METPLNQTAREHPLDGHWWAIGVDPPSNGWWGSVYEEQWRTQRKEARTLHALYQTCRLLRALLQPQLWAAVHVDSVARLGRLRETLRISPHLAQLVRCFHFSWEYDDAVDLDVYPAEEGTLLDMAFRNRRNMWRDYAKKYKARIEPDNGWVQAFHHNDEKFQEPGITGGFKGPDGKGEDCRIKNPTQLIDSIVEVVAQLSVLETFHWDTEIMPMPAGVFDALAKLKSLTALHVSMSSARGNVDSCECIPD